MSATTTATYRLPARFADDYTASGCHEEVPGPWVEVARSPSLVTVQTTLANLGNLLDRADLYADPGYAADLGPDYRAVVRSARVTLRRFASLRADARRAFLEACK